MKYEVKFTNQFKKDLKMAKKQNRDLDRLFDIVNLLAEGGPLDAKYRDHDLSGNYTGTRECHIEPDWLLVQKIQLMCLFSCSTVLVRIQNYSKNDFGKFKICR